MKDTMLIFNGRTFCKLFAQHMKGLDLLQTSTLLRNLKSEELRSNTAGWEMQFVRCCRRMVELHHFDAILCFVHALFSIREQCDLQLLKKLLSQVEIREGYDLSQLCQDFVLDMHDANEWNDPIVRAVDLYQEEPNDLEVDPGANPRIRMVLPRTLMKHVYGLQVLDAQQVQQKEPYLRQEDVDAVANFVLREAVGKHAAYCADVEETNHEYAQWGVKERLVDLELTEYERTKALPGALLPLLRMAELTRDMPLCHYILETYILPALAEVDWDAEKDEDVPVLADIAFLCAEYLEAILQWQIPTILDSGLHPWYLQNVFYRELLGKGDPSKFLYVTDGLMEFCRQHSLLCDQWVNVLQRGGHRLKIAMTEAGRGSAYSHHILTTAYLLYFCGKEESAAQFLLQQVGELNDEQRRRPHFLILLTRCVMTVSRSDNANAVYGLFCYEMDRMIREQAAAMHDIGQMVQFVRDAEDYIRRNNKRSLLDKRTYHEILFGDGKFMSQVEAVETKLRHGGKVTHEQFREMVRLTDALCYQSGVRLAPLGLPKVDDCDKLYHALPTQLRRRGQALMRHYQTSKLYWENAAHNDVLRNVNLHLQNRLFKLQCAQVKENLQRATALKQNLPEHMSEAEQEALIAQISQIAEDLMSMMLVSRQGRGEVERELTMLREKFEQTHLPGCEDLMEKLPENVRDDVQNYLVTSALVFRMMEAQKDESLDYSAALISMTKALELVMHHVYTQLDVKYDESFIAKDTDKVKDQERKKQITEVYFTKTLEPRKQLTLRPYVELLSKDRFTLWGVDQVLDIGMLSQFSDVQLHTRKDASGNFVLESFGDNADKNRKCFKKALGCICDNYRNRSAHPNVVTLIEVEECRRLLIDGQNLLWILLAILK